jgi:hypothetical protein
MLDQIWGFQESEKASKRKLPHVRIHKHTVHLEVYHNDSKLRTKSYTYKLHRSKRKILGQMVARTRWVEHPVDLFAHALKIK